jgi:AcrR family transcriptional regulator
MSDTDTAARPRWERRKEARPAELAAAALDVFVEKGFACARLDDVAARAGVSKGTLYLYFENKEDLLKAVVRENIVERITRAADDLVRYEGATEPLLRELITRWWREFGSTSAGGLTKLMMAESGNFPEIARFYLDEVIEPWHRLLGAVLERGIRRREFRRVDVPTFVRVMSAPLAMLALWKHSFGPCSQQHIDPEHYIATLLDAFLVSLRAPAPLNATARKPRTARKTIKN